MNVVIVGLRRSGTTAFWGLWRQDARFACYNEPFNQQLSYVGDPAWDGARFTAREFVALHQQDPALFWRRYAPIARHAELQDNLSDQQRTYLEWLQATGDHTCVDVTRCHFKLRSLQEIDPEALVVHLYRPPANWVTSVVQPSTTHFGRLSNPRLRMARTLQMQGRNFLFRRRFWTSKDGHRFKGFNELIGTHPGTLFGVRLAEAGLDPAAVYAMPDVGRLLAFWKIHFDHVEREGRDVFGDRFVSLNFNDLCRQPADLMRQLYRKAGLEAPEVNVRHIHPPPPVHAAGDPRWQAYAEELGLPAFD